MDTQEVNQYLNSLPSEEKSRLISIGRQWGSSDTLKQADKTLNGLKVESCAALLMNNGFSTKDTEHLAAFRRELIEAGGRRTSARTTKKITKKAYQDSVKSGNKTRKKALSILHGALGSLRKVASDEAKQAANAIDSLLSKIKPVRENARTLAGQLEQFQKLLAEDQTARTATLERGGEKLMLELATQIQALRVISPTRPSSRGTAPETEKMDLLDGLIVELTRSAREASLSAAEETGQRSIAVIFELDCLYRPRSRAEKKKNV